MLESFETARGNKDGALAAFKELEKWLQYSDREQSCKLLINIVTVLFCIALCFYKKVDSRRQGRKNCIFCRFNELQNVPQRLHEYA